MKFEFIEGARGPDLSVRRLCERLQVSEAGFYSWRSRRDVPDGRRRANEVEIVALVRRLHRVHPACGRPRLLAMVRAQGHAIGANRLRRIMLEAGIKGAGGRKRIIREREPQSKAPAAPNVLAREFNVSEPNKVWSGDITELQIGDARLRLAIVLDLFSRRVVGWKLDAAMKTSLVTGALKVAVRRRRPAEGLVFHSDQGSQYSSARFREMVRRLGFRQSMSRRGNCWDNAPTESFFATLKKELVYTRTWTSRSELEAAIVKYLDHYNSHRPHSSLGLRSPRDYERHHAN